MLFSVGQASEEQNSETSLAVMTGQSRWSSFRGSRPSLQWFLGPFRCLPVGELLPNSTKQRQKDNKAIQSTADITARIGLDTNKVSFISDDQDDISMCSIENDSERANSLDAKPSSLVPTVLDVDFARVTLRSCDTWPNYEFVIEGLESIITTDGALALLDFLDFVLNLPEVESSGFMLTYDVSKLTCPQLDLMSWIMRYIGEPQHKESWQQRCVCCKVIVQSGIYYDVAESFFSFLFSVYRPPCRFFLTTELGAIDPETLRCFKPEDEFDEGLGWLSNIGTGFLDLLLPPFPHQTPSQQKRATSNSKTVLSESDPNSTSGEALSSVAFDDKEHASSCPAFLEVDFCTLSQGFDKTTNMGYLNVVGNATPMLDENLAKVMDFMDVFVNSPNAEKGFSITYDLRKLGTPSMSQIMRVADWGKNSVRQDKWLKLNLACKVVVTAGIRFSMTTAVLKSFFYMCPPVCRTTIVTDPDEPEENGIVFLPPSDAIEKRSAADETRSDDGSASSCGFSADASESTAVSATAANGALKIMEANVDVEQDELFEPVNRFECNERVCSHEKRKERCSDDTSWEPMDTYSWIPDSFHVDMW